MVLGLCALALLAFAVAGVAAVGLLGKSDEGSGSGAAPARHAVQTGGTTVTVAALTSIVERAGTLTGKKWSVTGASATVPPPSPCSPANFGDGEIAAQRKAWGYHVSAGASGGSLVFSVYQYATAQQMAADLNRSDTDGYKACLATDAQTSHGPGAVTDTSVRRTAAPLGLDGVVYLLQYRLPTVPPNTVGQVINEQVIVIGVGRLRAVIRPLRCCTSWESDGEHTLVAGVALEMAKAQSLPAKAALTAAAAGPHLSEGPNPCGLLSSRDFSHAAVPVPTGRQLGHGDDGEVTCRWTTNRGTVELVTTVYGYEFQPPSSEPVTGVGDRAVWIEAAQGLVVWINGRNFIVSVHEPASAATVRTATIALARSVLAHRAPDPPTASGG